MPKAVIIGVGPDRGLGAQLCKRFARGGLEVVVAGRTRAALDAVVADIGSSGGKAPRSSPTPPVRLTLRRCSTMPAPLWIWPSTTRATTRRAVSSRWRRTISRELAGGVFRRVSVRAGSAAPHGPAEAGHYPVHRRQRLAARPLRLWRLQLRQGGAADVRPGDGQGVRFRRYPRRPRRRRWRGRRRQNPHPLSEPTRAATGCSTSRASWNATPSFTGSTARPGRSRSTSERPWSLGELEDKLSRKSRFNPARLSGVTALRLSVRYRALPSG